ncbi:MULTISPECIES: hypothetical protein [unclassified Desulfovibrio]|uniref:hypothetical protein n=1 Tax=unclassified Desulfovibrio TaxID=2593640 RepID=UPI002FD8995B
MSFFKSLLGLVREKPKQKARKPKKDGRPLWKDWVEDNPNAKWETRISRESRFMTLTNDGKIEHVIVFMYLLGDDAKVSSPVRKAEKQRCQKLLKEWFGEITAPIKYRTTDETVEESLKRQAKLRSSF